MANFRYFSEKKVPVLHTISKKNSIQLLVRINNEIIFLFIDTYKCVAYTKI